MKQRVVYFLILAKYTVCLIRPVSVSVSWLISIKNETHSLQDPVTEMFCSGQVSLKH